MDQQPKTTYIAKRDPDNKEVVARKLTVSADSEWKFSELPARRDLRNHSPTGFEFGYSGSGPAQLSLAVLADALGPERAVELYQKFKAEFVAKASSSEFQVTLEAVQDWAAKQVLPPTDSLDAWSEFLGE